jgi:DNA-binding NarL/FixJ family response regulator
MALCAGMEDMHEETGARSLSPSGASSAVVFDRHPVWLHALGTILESVGIRAAGMATSAAQMLHMVETLAPDLLVAEPSTAGGPSEVGLLRRARRLLPALRIVVVSASDDPEDIAAAFDAGALAYVLKTAQADDIATAMRQAFGSSIFLRSTVAAEPAGMRNGKPDESVAAARLTRRELEILMLVAEGHTNAQLARMLWVTEQTVKFHLSNIYRKLDVSNRTEASRWAQRHGLLSPSPEPVAS